MRIRDPGWRQFGSGIRDGKSRIQDKHPGFATLVKLLLDFRQKHSSKNTNYLARHYLKRYPVPLPLISVAEPHHIDADPYPDTACHFDTGPDSDPVCHFDADPDLTFHFDADSDPDPSF
jgi:hypothetical protein